MMRVSAESNQLLIFDLRASRWERFNVSRSLCFLKTCTLWNLQSSKDLYLAHTVFEKNYFNLLISRSLVICMPRGGRGSMSL